VFLQSEFIKVPVAYPIVLNDRQFLPNMVNMIVIKNQAGARRLDVPKPFFEPFKEYLKNRAALSHPQINADAAVSDGALYAAS